MYEIIREQMAYKRMQRAAERARLLDRKLVQQIPQGQNYIQLYTVIWVLFLENFATFTIKVV